ncbi:MAG: GlsB/YeaQ/YmgE family stress response membrane protein [Deltaproteobacteria bacterium]|nr:GlsB/YeaQ/YmgE family stress response membrane protein [Deltaproteobacteria bacterium]
MSLESIVIILIIGGLAGWLAGLIVKGYGFGLLGNIVIGIIGAFVGSWVLGQFGFHVGPGLIGSVLNATVGAVLVLVVIGLVRRLGGR